MADIKHDTQHASQPRRGMSTRRPPAHQSVSLLHGDREPHHADAHAQLDLKRSQELYSTRANPPSTLSSRPAYHKGSSGESSNTERWFENNNNNNRFTSPSFMNDEPPYLLRNSSSSEESPNYVAAPLNPANLPYRTSVFPLTTVASSSEDFRGVIDDLTVQNKRLKRRLRKYEKRQDSHLQEEKLFEVRVHGLPAGKKRELEEVLKKFVMNCDSSTPDQISSSKGQNANRGVGKKGTSRASTRFGDSAYASMSGTNQTSSATSRQHLRNTSQQGFSASGLSGKSMQKSNAPALSKQMSGHSSSNSMNPSIAMDLGQGMSHQQNQSIQSYLHDIPVGLFPMHGPVAMTENAKKKLVVRRLESIFAGEASTTQGHQQALQQQEVSHSAVRADRQAMEASGQRFPEEGAREAQFMTKSRKSPSGNHVASANGHHTANDSSATKAGESRDVKIEERDFAKDNSSEQRPTRPLDLDPSRAQVPQDNIEYIRHLGFSPRDYATMSPPSDGHGWIYINLLTNMAQLHTLSVTPEFVRKSVADVSSHLEVSNDGRKLRWKGGVQLSRTSNSTSPEDEHGRPSSGPRHSAVSHRDQQQRSRLANSMSNDGSSEAIHRLIRASSKDKLVYTPLFFHKSESEDEDNADMSDDHSSGWSSPKKPMAGDSSELPSSGVRTQNTRRKKAADDGPIIFYNRANFCTDLSGDSRGKQLFAVNNTNYSRVQTLPLGAVHEHATSASDMATEFRGPFSSFQPAIFDDAMEIDTLQQGDVKFQVIGAQEDISSDDSSAVVSEGIDFEASGIGGVMPKDHFSIRVKTRQQIATSAPSRLGNTIAKLPPCLRKGLGEEDTGPGMSKAPIRALRIMHQVVSERRKDLPPSELPPPSFYPLSSFDSSSDEDSENDDEDTMSDVQLDQGKPLPSAAPQPIDFSSLDSSESESGSESEEEYSESEVADDDRTDGIDLLAHARLADPVAIKAREREYDCEMAERLAEEIPAGSSAATAGGGSGFTSPVNKVDNENGNAISLLRGVSSAETPSLKRARTSDSLSMALNSGSRSRKSPKLEDREAVIT